MAENKEPKVTTSIIVPALNEKRGEPVEGIKNIKIELTEEETKIMYKGNNIFSILVKWYLYRGIKWIKVSFRPPFTVTMTQKTTKSIDVETEELSPGTYSIKHYSPKVGIKDLNEMVLQGLLNKSRIGND